MYGSTTAVTILKRWRACWPWPGLPLHGAGLESNQVEVVLCRLMLLQDTIRDLAHTDKMGLEIVAKFSVLVQVL